jgi:hypothetical protein
MIAWTRVVSALLVALLLSGLLASTVAAQQPAQPPAPDLFQETLKADEGAGRHDGAYSAGAVVTNVFLVPGRAITCVLGSVVGVVVLGATLGSGYRAASTVVHEGCGGKWVVTGEDLRPETAAGRHMDAWEQR